MGWVIPICTAVEYYALRESPGKHIPRSSNFDPWLQGVWWREMDAVASGLRKGVIPMENPGKPNSPNAQESGGIIKDRDRSVASRSETTSTD